MIFSWVSAVENGSIESERDDGKFQENQEVTGELPVPLY